MQIVQKRTFDDQKWPWVKIIIIPAAAHACYSMQGIKSSYQQDENQMEKYFYTEYNLFYRQS